MQKADDDNLNAYFNANERIFEASELQARENETVFIVTFELLVERKFDQFCGLILAA